jgi:hypothetical protein
VPVAAEADPIELHNPYRPASGSSSPPAAPLVASRSMVTASLLGPSTTRTTAGCLGASLKSNTLRAPWCCSSGSLNVSELIWASARRCHRRRASSAARHVVDRRRRRSHRYGALTITSQVDVRHSKPIPPHGIRAFHLTPTCMYFTLAASGVGSARRCIREHKACGRC